VVYYPLKWTVKALGYLPKKAYHATINTKKTKQTDPVTKKALSYEKAYGLESDTHVKSASKAIKAYSAAKDNLIKQYGSKYTNVYNIQTGQYDKQYMNIIDRYNYSKYILTLAPNTPNLSAEHLKKARILINFVNKKLQSVDHKSQKILDYIKSQKKEGELIQVYKNSSGNPYSVPLTKEQRENKKTSATDKIAYYINKIKYQEHIN
jgi:hypothetical protein